MIKKIPSIQAVNDLIRLRRSVFPDQYIEKEIAEEDLRTILENATWAPNHRKTEPWRFKVYRGMAKERLGQFLADRYQKLTEPASFKKAKYDKTIRKVQKSAAIVAICMQRDAEERLPEWEEIAAVSCAVQNMWLTCVALQIGCYWSSPKSITEEVDFLQLKEGQRCLGLFYMGYWKQRKIETARTPLDNKIEWIDK